MPDVTTVTDAVVGTQANHGNRRRWTTPSDLYLFYIDTANAFVFRKSVNRGRSFGSKTVINTDGLVGRFDIWAQRWTAGRTGRLILTAFDNNLGEINFRTLNTVDDSLAAEVNVVTRTPGDPASRVTVCEARGGNIAVTWNSNSVFLTNGLRVSTDGGLTFGGRANPWETLVNDALLLVPGNEAAQDFYAPFHDEDVSELMLKHYNNAGNSWSEILMATGMGLSGSKLFQASTLHSDNHVFLIMFEALIQPTTDLRIWEITNATTFVERTNILTDNNESLSPALTIDQSSGRLYVAYSRGTPQGNRRMRYKFSDDRGITWSAEIDFADVGQQMQAAQADLSIGADGGRWQPGWYEIGGANLFSNTVNDIQIPEGLGAGGAIGGHHRAFLL